MSIDLVPSYYSMLMPTSIKDTDVPVNYVQPMLVACARQLIEHISNSGSSKALVLSLGLRDHSSETLKGIVSAVIEKFAETHHISLPDIHTWK
ncbi:UNVERIFIED_CONTAM: hypothetical protein Sangu_1287800 [Sesamum angustifolium]|uniref:Proteasome assembly chaperone 3 n=1 Tax=Sesamum angustifolium TaxID=2727405 RepID=A0AAW2NMZ0_9LAMI